VRALPVLLGLLVAACSSSGGTALPTASPSPTATVTPTPSATPSVTPSATPSPSARPTPSRTPSAAPSYAWSARRVTAADLPHSWHAGCPVAPAQLRLLTLPYRDFGGVRRTGEVVVNARVVDDVVAVFRDLYRAGFPIRSLRLVDAYGGDDDRSMAADNTSAFNCRNAVGGSGWSQHAYGLAVDVNPVENPYVYGGQVLPPAGRAYLDRSDHRQGMAWSGSAVNRAFARQGWSWGGRWSNPDYQHFSTNGR
jgi:hypothetical protein